uniref:Uncharacterized protein n=1 Tax=Arundo donax TaxID=35708 RepID=A0A0A9AL77_ARUDO
MAYSSALVSVQLICYAAC